MVATPSRLRRWYVPSITGDVRLEATGDSASELTVVSPTAYEEECVRAFAAEALKRGWLDAAPVTFPKDGEVRIAIGAAVAVAGEVLAPGVVKNNPGVITGVKMEGGKVLVTADHQQAVALASSATAEAAVTGRRATPCCPNAVTGPERRASEVLREFASPLNWKRWINEGYVLVTGGVTGHRYRLAHRNSPLAEKQTRICYDLTDRGTLHFHDVLLPPAEEVLNAALILGSRLEPWLRNQATCVFGRFRDVFENPIGPGIDDGILDSAMFQGFGATVAQGMRMGATPTLVPATVLARA